MKRNGVCVLLAGCLSCLIIPARAEVPQKIGEAFPQNFRGIWISRLPEQGTVLLGDRVLRRGDVLTGDQLSQVTCVGEPGAQKIAYYPLTEEGLGEESVAVFSLGGHRDEAPVAEDSAMETYRNLPNQALLRVSDPEQQPLTVTLVRQPRRGTVTLEAGNRVTYTPAKNKVGVDSFTYEARDPGGNVSREATVTVTILKPTDADQYGDTAGLSCSFQAEWMKNTGIFEAESLGEVRYFQPEKPLNRGEFLTMLLKTLEIPREHQLTAACREAPIWLQPYVAAALRAGLTAGLPWKGDYDREITEAEAAVLLQNALDLPVPVFARRQGVPLWAASASAALEEQGILLSGEKPLTRGKAAEILYAAHCLRTA